MKYSGIHARRMKYPQLLTKLAKTHAHVGALESNSRNGVLGFFSASPFGRPPASFFSTTLPPPSMSASSAFPTRRFPLGKVVANAAQTTPHATPAKPKTRNGAATPAEVASIAGAARSPTMLPLWNPPMHAATARLRSRFGTHRAIRLSLIHI